MQYLMQAGESKWWLVFGSRTGLTEGLPGRWEEGRRRGNRILVSSLSPSLRDTFTILTRIHKVASRSPFQRPAYEIRKAANDNGWVLISN